MAKARGHLRLAHPDQLVKTAVKPGEALVPPKPNEFDSATLTSRSRALCGTRSIGVSTEGLSRLIVGGAI